MTDQEVSPPFRWERSPNYRTFYASFFKFRFAVGDGSITFSQYSEDPGSPTQNVIQEQVNVVMSWPGLKQLGEYISVAVQEMEREVGPIASLGISKEELRQQAIAIIKEFAIRKK